MKRMNALLLVLCAALTACGSNTAGSEAETQAVTETENAEITEAETEAETQPETSAYIEVVEDGMMPVTADALKDGSYPVTVSSSSAMFSIESCILTVENGAMTAEMTMSGTGYLWLFMGSGEEAAAADESDCIPFEEKDGVHTFTVPVEALDKGIPCAAYSKRKECWYDRTILFRADSLPPDALGEQITAASLGLSDGEYTVEVTLAGGSGKASVASPAKLTVKDGKASAEIIWGSSKYDYMVVDGVRFDPISMEAYSIFEIPVPEFDYRMPVAADTTAMSEPHEIEYTLYFDSASIGS